MTKFIRTSAILIGAAIIAAPVFAGEIKGPPPTGNVPSPPNSSISNGNSLCSFSGLNDTPDGLPNVDPGGQVQSFGYFMSQFGLYDPSDPAQRIEELYLATLSRLPDENEKQTCLSHVSAAESPEKGLQAVLWSLLNTREFILQH